MKRITALNNQTPFDIAVQEMGSVEGVFDILEMNPEMILDYSIGSGIKVWIPPAPVNSAVAGYYKTNDIHPATGLEKEVIL